MAETAKSNKPTDEQPKGPNVPLMDKARWDNQDGEEYGGQADILKLEPGQAAGPLTYLNETALTTELGETVAHSAMDADKNVWRMPIHATFIRAVEQANLANGDKFLVRRLPDQIKKAGKGKGKPMQIWGVKVTDRKPRVAAA